MASTNNSEYSIRTILIIAFIFMYSFMILIMSINWLDNYKIIKHKSEFKKIKVKIDSSTVFSNSSGKSSGGAPTTSYYFNKGSSLKIKDTKEVLLKYENPTEKIQDFMSNHNDSLYVWILKKEVVKFANENEKRIDVSEEVENNKRIIIYFSIWVIVILLAIKLKSKIV